MTPIRGNQGSLAKHRKGAPEFEPRAKSPIDAVDGAKTQSVSKVEGMAFTATEIDDYRIAFGIRKRFEEHEVVPVFLGRGMERQACVLESMDGLAYLLPSLQYPNHLESSILAVQAAAKRLPMPVSSMWPIMLAAMSSQVRLRSS